MCIYCSVIYHWQLPRSPCRLTGGDSTVMATAQQRRCQAPAAVKAAAMGVSGRKGCGKGLGEGKGKGVYIDDNK